MLRTKTVLATATAALVAAVGGSLGAAQADTTGASGTTGATGTTAVSATITVNGAGFVTENQSASSSTFHADYVTALGDALTDAKAKATMLATQAGDTLGVVQSITEQSNDNSGCASPMFAASGAAKGAASVAPTPRKKHRKHHAPVRVTAVARAADDTNSTCTLEADVTVIYAMSPS